jgi:membrane protein implicated in regulation of membrane protease activity
MMQVMFVVIGVIGALLLISTLIFDDVIDDLVPGLDFFSGPVIGAFLAAFGLFGWFLDDGVDSPVIVAVAAALGGGALFGAGTYRLTRALMYQPTDATPTTQSLVGTSARVVTPIRARGIGEVLVTLGGAPSKFTATADGDLPAGTAVVVIAVESPTKVRVQTEAEFWA